MHYISGKLISVTWMHCMRHCETKIFHKIIHFTSGILKSLQGRILASQQYCVACSYESWQDLEYILTYKHTQPDTPWVSEAITQ
jgi:hypothetical protein